ncbi:Gfo/Idh/MocA family protein [Paenibacillus albus]|uniref:Gfo/Idh/MocA family oxidoreductase n=1 Tax=Paenibacillus albus TaxID=2495582 RepID=A0A3Q8X416_9BACL|nr:Gfo/Idh/MocA family oxidoreductase [Paenibacillus albus]AZN39971.1 Gfo/Idh/MocA family oxidoreductase [Paenibacillus albus]
MNKLTAAVVGGGAGGQLSMNALHLSEKYELVAAADLRPEVCEKLKQKYPGLRTYTSHTEMFEDCPTDVVCVSTFPPSHEAVTLDALAALPQLKGIVVEKPLGDTVASGRRILSEIQKRNLPMAVPHGLLVKATPLEIIERVQRGEIGELKLVEIQNKYWDIINAGIHWLNFFVALTRNETMDYVMCICESSTRTYRDGMQVETTAVTYGQTKSGVRVVMNTGDDVFVNREGKDTLFRLIGTKGQIEFWGWESGYLIQNAEYPESQLIVPEELPESGHLAHLNNIARMIETGERDYSIPESSLLALEIVEGAYISSRTRSKVAFPVDSFEAPAEPDWNPGAAYSGSGGGRDGRKLV